MVASWNGIVLVQKFEGTPRDNGIFVADRS